MVKIALEIAPTFENGFKANIMNMKQLLLAILRVNYKLFGRLPFIFHKSMGYLLMDAWRYEEAAHVFEELNKRHPHRKEGYEGLMLVAKKINQPDLLLKLLKEATQKFPNHIDFVAQYINILMPLGKWKEIGALLKKSKARFYDHPTLLLAEATCLRKQYQFQEAQVLLDKAVAKNPNHLTLKMTQANNYVQIGEHAKAEAILDTILPQLDFGKKYLPELFVSAYSKVLSEEKGLKKLKNFYESGLNAGVQNQTIIHEYTTLLLSEGAYRKAQNFIKRMIKKLGKKLTLRNYVMLFFEKEKAKNIRELTENKVPILTNDFEEESLPDFLKRMESYLAKYPQFDRKTNPISKTFQQLKELSQLHPTSFNTAVSPKTAWRLAQKIIAKIHRKQPFSLIRLGDGEGHFLPYENEFKSFEKSDRSSSQRIWWGSEKITESKWQNLKADYHSAILNADLLGMPCPWRSCRTMLSFTSFQSNLNSDARGLQAIFGFLLSNNLNQNNNAILTSCHLHTHFEEWGLWDLILKEISSCSVISCHQGLEKLLLEKHQITVRSFHKIPTEYKYASLFQYDAAPEKSHFPHHFDRIRDEISVAYPGEVFLVAAGFLGKFYCQTIKEKGGIALDIGSAADYWLGHQSRVWKPFSIDLTRFEHLRCPLNGHENKECRDGAAHLKKHRNWVSTNRFGANAPLASELE